jgi:hypothetical protein
MTPRRADPRIGHFEVPVWDFSSDSKYSAKTHYVDRWRLEKKDPQAEVSEPKEPIVFYIDRTVPEKYRPTVREAILEWNKAFEKAGFKDAIVVKQQDAEGTIDTFDARHSTVRWFVSTDGGFAIGPSTVDSRTGEILNAQVAIPEAWSRDHRTFVVEQAPFPPPSPLPSATPAADAYPMALRDGNFCTYAADALNEMQFGLDVLEERGEIQAGSAEAEAFVNASLKSAVMHEVGHALGLRHNFRASTVYPLAKLSDPAWGRERGLAGSVMDYSPINIAVNGEAQGVYFDSTIGPYDYWAIEYAYRELPKETESEELAKIASRGATDPLLAFSSDEEAIAGLDPDASRFDLGADPLAYLQKRLQISQELWQRLQTKKLKPGESYAVLRRTFDAGFRQFSRSAARLRRNGAAAVDSRAAFEAARGAQHRRRGHLLGGQLPVQARLPAQHGDRLSRHRAWQYEPVQSRLQSSHACAVAAGGDDEHDALRRRAREDPGIRSEGRRRPGVDAPRALCGAARVDLERAWYQQLDPRAAARPAARACAARGRRPGPPGVYTCRRGRTVPRGSEDAFEGDQGGIHRWQPPWRQPRRADARAPHRIGGNPRRGTEGAVGAARCLSARVCSEVRPPAATRSS